MKKKYGNLFKAKSGIRLDLGCGGNKAGGFVGMDQRDIKGVDIVHNVEDIPYPIPDETCLQILANHLFEHICPRKMIPMMNELWRIMKVGGQLMIGMPYAGSSGFWQDPSHCHAWNEATAYYFDPTPANFAAGQVNILYNVYKPLPWKIIQNDWVANGNLQISFIKRALDEKK